MSASSNEAPGGRATPVRQAQIRPGRLQRFLAESLLAAWAVVTEFFDGDHAATRRRLRSRNRRRMMERRGYL